MSKSNDSRRKNSAKIYLDYAAGVQANPGSIHHLGVEAKKELQNSRAKVAGVLGSRQEEIIFTSGGTESNNIAIQGVVLAWHEQMNRPRGKNILPHIITTNIEHPSVLETFKILEKRKLAKISLVPVDGEGIVDPKKIKMEIRKNTILISVGYANNEIGTIQPIREISKIVRHYKKNNRIGNIFFHTDAVQAANFLDLNVERLGVDLLSLSGSKIEGAGRVGVLYKRKSVLLANIFGGGDQEGGLRPGTENLREIIKFAGALESAQRIKEIEIKKLTRLRDYFITQLQHSNILKNAGMSFNGDLKNRLPNNVNVSFQNIPSDLLVIELSAKGIMASAKSACKSGEGAGSYVIKALHPGQKSENGGVRFSFGGLTTKMDIDRAVKALSETVSKLQKWYSP